MTLDRNLTDNHTEIEQAAFEVNNLVPGIGLSPTRCCWPGYSYADAYRARLGVNYKQIPVNGPGDGAQLQQGRIDAEANVSDPVYAPNSKGGPKADAARYPQVELGRPTVRSSAPPTPHARTMTTSSRPESRSARCWITRPVSAWSQTSPAIYSTACPTRCSSAPSNTGSASTNNWANGWRRRWAPGLPSCAATRPVAVGSVGGQSTEIRMHDCLVAEALGPSIVGGMAPYSSVRHDPR